MKQTTYVLFCFYFLLFFLSCQKEIVGKWICTQNENLYIWVETSEQDYTYYWNGASFDKLAHGAGILSIYNNDSLTIQKRINAYYGAINAHDFTTLADGSSYIGKIKDDLFEGFGVYLKGQDVYVGTFAGSKPNGTLNWYKNGILYYSGEWQDGNFQGKGKLYKEDGNIKKGTWDKGYLIQTYCKEQTSEGFYDGYVLNGKPDGIGIMHYKDSSYYNGEWINGKYDGEGIFIFKKDSIIGNWKDGKLNGSGIYKTANFRYEGDWIDNKPEGFGSLQLQDSSLFYGEWIEGKINGYGDILFANKDSYTGNLIDNTFNGEGVYKYAATGDSYEGEWKNGLQHGYGQYKSSKFEYIGDWEEGWMNGAGHIDFPNKDFYEGNFVENKFYGTGHYFFSNGNSYEGEFINSKLNGLGIFRFANGNVYEGEFQEGKIKGDGTLYYTEKNDTIAITANWDGTNRFPKQASVLFSNGDLYEGELINGFPTENGVWSTMEERQKGKNPFINSTARVNEFYKKHKDTWNKVVKYTSIALTVVEITTPIAGEIMIATGVGTPAGAVLIATGKIAGAANIILNTADAAISTASTTIEVYDAILNEKDATEALKNWGAKITMNTAFIIVPPILKSSPTRKTKVLLNASANSAENVIRNSIVIFEKNKAFGKIIKITKNKTGKLQKSVENSAVAQISKNLSSTAKKKFQSGYLATLLSKTLIYKELQQIKAKGPIKLTKKDFDYLMSNADKANLHSFIKTYTGNKTNYLEFFIRLADGNKKQATELLDQPKIRKFIDTSIRVASGEKGYHEWLMTKNFKSFLLDNKWGEDGYFLAIAQSKLIQKTRNINFKEGGGHVASSRPNSSESVKFHERLAKVIDQSKTKEELFVNVRTYAKEALTEESYKEFNEIFKNILQTVKK